MLRGDRGRRRHGRSRTAGSSRVDGVHTSLGDVGRHAGASAIRGACGGTDEHTLVTGIGELTTNDPAGDGPLPTRRWCSTATGVAWVGAAARRPPPTSGSTSTAARCCPAWSTATPTWSSPATGRRSSPRGWPASRTPPAGSRTTVAATRAASDDELADGSAPARRRGARAGHHDHGDQDRLRADRRRRARVGPAGRRRSPTR